MNEETIIQSSPMANEAENTQQVEKQGTAWKQVTLGGVAGILMGAGAMYGAEAYAANQGETPTEDVPEEGVLQVKVAEVSDNMSFAEAFEAARDQVGAGGVFRWHGGIYNTYTAEEWNGMSEAEKNDFAELVKPEVSATHINTAQITEETPDIHVHVHVHEAAQTATTGGDVQIVDPKVAASYEALENDDVHIVGYREIEGHLAVGYDVDGDDGVDVAIIDLGEPGLSGDDLITNGQEIATVEDVMGGVEQDPYAQYASMDNPEVASDMPDYMNDADLSGMA